MASRGSRTKLRQSGVGYELEKADALSDIDV
jgi:hypothetical protein